MCKVSGVSRYRVSLYHVPSGVFTVTFAESSLRYNLSVICIVFQNTRLKRVIKCKRNDKRKIFLTNYQWMMDTRVDVCFFFFPFRDRIRCITKYLSLSNLLLTFRTFYNIPRDLFEKESHAIFTSKCSHDRRSRALMRMYRGLHGINFMR